MMTQNDKEFEVLGYKLRFRPDDQETSEPSANISAEEVVAFVNKRAELIKSRFTNLEVSQVATLLALELAREKLSLEKEFKTNLQNLELRARRALELIDEVSPPSH